MKRCLLLFLTSVAIGSVSAEDLSLSETRSRAVMSESHFEVFDKYCLDCHDSLSEEGEVNLEDLSFDITQDIPTAEMWQKVLNAINSGEMPPKDKDQISDEEKTTFLAELSTRMVDARNILSDSGGVITMRRLNRREYQNTMEALLGHAPDVSNLPTDADTGEFDTSGASLYFSSDQLEQYLAVARKAVADANLPTEQPEPSVRRFEAEAQVTPYYLEKLSERIADYQNIVKYRAQDEKDAKSLGFIDEYQVNKQARAFSERFTEIAAYLDRPESNTGAPMTFYMKRGASKPVIWTDNVDGTTGGKYILRFRVAAYDEPPEYMKYLEYGFQPAGSQSLEILGERRATGTLKGPTLHEIEIDHPRGQRGRYFVRQLDYMSRSARAHVWQEHLRKTGEIPAPTVWVDYVEIEGPLHSKWPTPETRIIRNLEIKGSESERARQYFSNFSFHAFRGKDASQAFLDRLMTRFTEKRDRGVKYRDALNDGLAVILSSPNFLYLIESNESGQASPIDDRELAIRLSYFLWSAPPDAELLDLGLSGKLSDPQTLRDQTNRMLADDRSNAFISAFADQWLHMVRLEMFQFHSREHPKFNEAVRRSARGEIYAMIRNVLDEESPLGTLLDADFVVVNDILGEYYDLEGVEGPAFRKVALPEGSPRGGLLGTAAIQVMGSDGIRSSPVERGVWVLKHLLNDPPPPAPANVPMLSRFDGEILSAKALQKVHQEEPQCAQCHQKIDTIGYGMENFTAGGLWRETEEIIQYDKKSKIVKETSFPIEAVGQLPDGEKFHGFQELRKAIAGREDAFSMSFSKALIAYGMGRPYAFSDEKLAFDLIDSARTENNQIASYIHGLVQSKSFQTK